MGIFPARTGPTAASKPNCQGARFFAYAGHSIGINAAPALLLAARQTADVFFAARSQGVSGVSGVVWIIHTKANEPEVIAVSMLENQGHPAAQSVMLRPAADSDLPALAAVYASAVETTGPQFYTEEQVRRWAEYPRQEPEAFAQFALAGWSFAALVAGELVGFASLERRTAAAGHVKAVYVHGRYQRQGIGSMLLERLLEHAEQADLRTLTVDASECSRPLLIRKRFAVIGVEIVERGDVKFRRYCMERKMPDGC